jgi:hypothetical protein
MNMGSSKSNMAALKKHLEDLTDLADSMALSVRRAWEAFDNIDGSNEPLKDSFGKITDAGVAMMHHMFATGDTNSKIAGAFDIAPSAVTYRRARWKAQK